MEVKDPGTVMGTDNEPLSARRERFMSLCWPHVDVLYGAAWQMTGRTDRTEESVQEALCRAWTYFDSFTEGANPRPWLFSILRNVIYAAARRRKHDVAKASLSDIRDDHAPEAPTDPSGRLVEQEVRRAIDELPRDLRDVVVLTVVEGLKYRDVAAMLEIPIGTVMSRLHRGRELLRERLASYAEGAEPRDPPKASPGGAA